jgi:hypothetical protein
MDAHHERIEGNMNAWRNKMKVLWEATEACPERTEVRIETDQEPMKAEIKNCLVEVEAADLEANPWAKEAVAEQ